MLNNFIPSMFSSLNGGEVDVSIMHCTALRVLPTFPPIVYHTYSIQGKYTQFYIQLVNGPHFGTGILLFGPIGQSGQQGKKSGFEEF